MLCKKIQLQKYNFVLFQFNSKLLTFSQFKSRINRISLILQNRGEIGILLIFILIRTVTIGKFSFSFQRMIWSTFVKGTKRKIGTPCQIKSVLRTRALNYLKMELRTSFSFKSRLKVLKIRRHKKKYSISAY